MLLFQKVNLVRDGLDMATVIKMGFSRCAVVWWGHRHKIGGVCTFVWFRNLIHAVKRLLKQPQLIQAPLMEPAGGGVTLTATQATQLMLVDPV